MMKFLSIANAIKLMLVIGVIAVFTVMVQSCEPSKKDDSAEVLQKKLEIAPFKRASLRKLQVLEDPPEQPNSIFVDGQKNTAQLSDYHGKYVLLNVWATWCPPCVVEMPSLNAMAGEFTNEDFAVVTISMDKDDESIQDFFAKNDLAHLTQWRDPYFNLAGQLGARGLPVTVIYDRGGHELMRLSGEADWTSDEAKALIKAVIGE